MKNSKTRDLASGPLLLQIIIFSIPLIASGVLQQLFNSCDIAVVGRFVGPEALAAVGSTAPLINLVLNIFMGLSVGANVLIASLEGQKKYKAISSAVHTIVLLSAVLFLRLSELLFPAEFFCGSIRPLKFLIPQANI